MWAMNLVARHTPTATRSDVLTATAGAVVGVIHAAHTNHPEWLPVVEAWEAEPFRKLFRRAKPNKWATLFTTPGVQGVTAVCDTASVAALTPVRDDALPPQVKKLQMSGWEPERIPATVKPSPNDVMPGVTVFVSNDPVLTLGKAAAAVGHTVHLAYNTMDATRREEWVQAGFPVTVMERDDSLAVWQSEANIVVSDAGYTEVDPGTVTAFGLWV